MISATVTTRSLAIAKIQRVNSVQLCEKSYLKRHAIDNDIEVLKVTKDHWICRCWIGRNRFLLVLCSNNVSILHRF